MLVGRMPDEHRRFLLSFERGEPDWARLDVAGLDALPAVRWRLRNLEKLSAPRRAELVEELAKALAATTTA